MLIYINNKNGVPIYEQIYSQIKTEIMGGGGGGGSPLPSIRNLAKDLRISVITTKRAYEELDIEVFIYTVPGNGSFVAGKNTELIREDNLRKIEEHIEEIMKLSATSNLKKNDIISMIDILFEEDTQ